MIYSFLYVVIFSTALVLIQKLDVSVPPLFSLLVTASIASLYFNLINRQYLGKMYSDCFKNKKSWFLVMLIVLIMWSTTMIGPGKIGASLFNFIYFAWLGFLGFAALIWQDKILSKTKILFCLILLGLISTNIYFEVYSSYNYETVSGMFLALIGGTSSFIYFKKSQALAKSSHLSATQILAVRFYLAMFVLLIVVPKHTMTNYLNLTTLFSLLILAFLSLIVPLYFSQKALEKITSEQHAIINSLCPISTCVIQEAIFHDVKIEQIYVYLLYALAIMIFYYINKSSRKLALEV